MEQKQKEQRTAQILYITIIMVMLIMALAVGLVTASNRGKAPNVTTDSTPSQANTGIPDKDHTSPSVTTSKKAAEATEELPEATTEKKAEESAQKPVIKEEEPASFAPEFTMPTIGNVSKTYSIDALVYSNTMEDYRTHNGIDICAALGDAVMAAADGVVSEVYEHPMMGNTIVISHAGDMKSIYQNLADEMLVSIGASVKEGEVIGAVGESALVEIAEEPHLHFEIMLSGERVDPLEFISDATMTIVYED